MGGGGCLQGRDSCQGAIKARHKVELGKAAGIGHGLTCDRDLGLEAGTRAGDGRGPGRNQVGRGRVECREQEAPGGGHGHPTATSRVSQERARLVVDSHRDSDVRAQLAKS